MSLPTVVGAIPWCMLPSSRTEIRHMSLFNRFCSVPYGISRYSETCQKTGYLVRNYPTALNDVMKEL